MKYLLCNKMIWRITFSFQLNQKQSLFPIFLLVFLESKRSHNISEKSIIQNLLCVIFKCLERWYQLPHKDKLVILQYFYFAYFSFSYCISRNIYYIHLQINIYIYIVSLKKTIKFNELIQKCFGLLGFFSFTKLKYVRNSFEVKRNGFIPHSIFLEHKYDSGYIIEN